MIVTVPEVRDRMSLKDIPEVNAAIKRTIVTSETVIAGILGTTFESGSRTDTFYFHPDYFPAMANQGIVGKLTQGFVKPSSTVVSWADSTRANLLLSPSPMDETEFYFDYERGIGMFNGTHLGRWVSVNYKAGFDEGDDSIPTWLKEAVLAYLPHLLLQPKAGVKGEIAAANTAAKLAYDIAGKILEPHMRSGPFQYSPIIRG